MYKHSICLFCAFINLALERIPVVTARQEKKGQQRQKKKTVHVPQPSLLACHDNTVRPSFFTLSGKGTCFIINSEREVRPPQDLSFYGDGRRLRGKQSRGNAEEKVLARSDPLCAEADVLPVAGV